MGSDDLSVEVTDLQLQDSGSYSIVADKSGVQLPTKIISLTVYGEYFHTASSSFSVFFFLIKMLCYSHVIFFFSTGTTQKVSNKIAESDLIPDRTICKL